MARRADLRVGRNALARKEADSWRIRPEPIAILANLLGSAVLLNAINAQIGYVRLFGLAQ